MNDTDTPRGVRLNWWQEAVVLTVAAITVAVLVKVFVMQAFHIPSESMEPALVAGDRIVVEKWATGTPRRGDVVVFTDPGGWLPVATSEPSGLEQLLTLIGVRPADGHLVKRVVGVPGDVIECCDAQGRLQVNEIAVAEEPLLRPGAACAGPMIDNCRWSAGPVPEGHVFVMGDHRSRSADSTAQMCRQSQTECAGGREFVSVERVVGRVLAVAWPPSRWQRVPRPDLYRVLDE
ncbi:signal peptidase I [Nocardioides limicola]|uniref:signal peptidase I n=1 Tax=Nocardioides limicola TaxID=2803368 RepID=UPI0027DDB76C|nr:signal peptidase I [Nocardioides sp. DJM-14]